MAGIDIDRAFDLKLSKSTEKDPNATKYDTVSFNEVISKDLKIMDKTAFTMCHENNIPIIVFNINKQGFLQKVVLGEELGTLVK